MKNRMGVVVLVMILVMALLALVACTLETSPVPTTENPPSLNISSTLPSGSDQDLLQQHPDYLDEALQQLEEVETVEEGEK